MAPKEKQKNDKYLHDINNYLNIFGAVFLQLAEIIEMIYQLAGAGVGVTITLMGAIVSRVARLNLGPFTLHFRFLCFLCDDPLIFRTLILESLHFAPTFDNGWPKWMMGISWGFDGIFPDIDCLAFMITLFDDVG